MDDLSFDDEGAFPAPENVPGQQVSRNAYKRFLENTGLAKDKELQAELANDGIWGNKDSIEWLEMWRQLRAEGWDWRKAAFIAWSATPTDKRWPKTLGELAITVLGLRSDRTVRMWREKHPNIEERISQLLISEFMDARAGVIRQSIHVAQTEAGPGFNDRQMILKVTKTLRDQVEVSGPGGGPVVMADAVQLGELTDDELERVIDNLQAAERAVSGRTG